MSFENMFVHGYILKKFKEAMDKWGARTQPGKTQPGKTQPGRTQPGKTQHGSPTTRRRFNLEAT